MKMLAFSLFQLYDAAKRAKKAHAQADRVFEIKQFYKHDHHN